MKRRMAIWLGGSLAAVGIGGLIFSGVSSAHGGWPWGWGHSAAMAAAHSGRYPGMMSGYGGMMGGWSSAPSAGTAGTGSPAGPHGGMMGGYGGMMAGWWGGAPAGSASSQASVDAAAVQAAETAVPAGAVVNAQANQVRFASTNVHLSVVAAPPDGRGMTFRIAGLTDPTVIVPAGARVTVNFINGDTHLPHNWLLVSAAPPYPAVPSGPAAAGASVPVLSPATGSGAMQDEVSFSAPGSGKFYYVCAVPGHAAAGMYGTFEVAG